MAKQKILVFQQNNSGEVKTRGIGQYGGDRFDIEVINIDDPLPEIIEDGTEYLPSRIEADLVLDYLRHPDLSHDLAALCERSGVPVIASGKKHKAKGLVTPKTCCGLAKLEALGEYAEFFGAPEFSAAVENGLVKRIDVLRGAPVGPHGRLRRKLSECRWPMPLSVSGWRPNSSALPIPRAGIRCGEKAPCILPVMFTAQPSIAPLKVNRTPSCKSGRRMTINSLFTRPLDPNGSFSAYCR